MINTLFRLSLIITVLATSEIWALAGTLGTPLGGMGTGYVKYNAKTGDLATSSRTPPAAGDMVCEFPLKMSTSSGFHFFGTTLIHIYDLGIFAPLWVEKLVKNRSKGPHEVVSSDRRKVDPPELVKEAS